MKDRKIATSSIGNFVAYNFALVFNMSRSAQRNMVPAPKRRKVEPVEQVTFDPDARQEYLTGFHKRKLERAKHGRELAQKKEREERIKARAEVSDL